MATYHKKLTEAFLARGITPPTKTGQQDEYFDTEVKSLSVRIGTSGKKTFSLVYRIRGDSKLRRGTLGYYSSTPDSGTPLREARRKALSYLDRAREGKDPFALSISPAYAGRTFEDVAKDYVSDYAKKHKRTWKEDKAKLERNFSDWYPISVENIGREGGLDQETVHAKILELYEKRGPYSANRNRSLILKLFKWARQQRKIPANPVPSAAELPKYPEQSRDRKFDDDEISSFWAGCETKGYPFGYCFELMLILGRRETPVAHIRWSLLDLKAGEWTNPAIIEKTKRTETVPLPPLAVRILKHIKKNYRFEGCDYVFTTNGKTPISGWTNAKKSLDTKCKALGKEIKTPWQLKDLRRTCRSYLPKCGATPPMARITLGHAMRGIDKVYDQYSYMKEKREALENWAAFLEGLISGKQSAKVVSLNA